MATPDIYASETLVAIQKDIRTQANTSFWRNMFFKQTFQSDKRAIVFGEINSTRHIAPFMLPQNPGRPIYTEAGIERRSYEPAYTKPKDSVMAADMMGKTPEEIAKLADLSPAERFQRAVVRRLAAHKQGIEALWDWMAAKALIDGQLPYAVREDTQSPGNGTPDMVLDFGRDPSHTVTLAAGARWGDTGVDIMDTLDAWMDKVGTAKFGGRVTDIFLGAKAVAAFRNELKNTGSNLVKMVDRNYEFADKVMLKRGIEIADPLNPVKSLGNINGVNIWQYIDTYPGNDALKDVLKPHQALLVAPSVEGIQAFGAIQDKAAGLAAMPMFAKMWDQEDPSATFVMTQSAPLMVPTNPNSTLVANVVAP